MDWNALVFPSSFLYPFYRSAQAHYIIKLRKSVPWDRASTAL